MGTKLNEWEIEWDGNSKAIMHKVTWVGEAQVLMSWCSVLSPVTGACIWEQSKVQRGQVHHWTGTHDQGQRMGVTFRTCLPFRDLWALCIGLHRVTTTISRCAPLPTLLTQKHTHTHSPLIVKLNRMMKKISEKTNSSAFVSQRSSHYLQWRSWVIFTSSGKLGLTFLLRRTGLQVSVLT